MSSNIWLRLCGSGVVEWPENVIGNTSPIRGEYIAALVAGDNGDLEPLIAMHRRYLRSDDNR